MKSQSPISNCVIIAVAIALMLSGCHIEKRVYRSGWHIEWNNANLKKTKLPDSNRPVEHSEMAASEREVFLKDSTKHVLYHLSDPIVNTLRLSSESEERAIDLRGVGQRRVRELETSARSIGSKQLHPKAGLSFLLGIIAISCVIVPVLVSGLGLAIIIGLIVLLIVSALLAQKMSRMALEDMHMARHRYYGKAMAAAGLVLSILALVALIGIAVIALLGAAFLTFV